MEVKKLPEGLVYHWTSGTVVSIGGLGIYNIAGYSKRNADIASLVFGASEENFFIQTNLHKLARLLRRNYS
jgi:hypothetical protein